MTRDEIVDFWGTKDVRTELKKTAMMAVIGLILAFIAPYDTFDMPAIYWRLIYWVGLLVLASVISGPIGRLIFPYILPKVKSPVGFLLIYSTLLSVPIFVVVAAGEIYGTSGQNLNWHLVVAYFSQENQTLFDLCIWFGQVVIITFMALGSISLVNHAISPTPTPKPEGPPPGYLFLRRLPHAIGQNLLCLQMEDHYVRAYTEQGDTLVRMRLKDAAAELEGYGGMQVHRSWWVVLSAIESVKRDGRRHMIYLKGGMQVPVSKTYADALKDAGYL